MGSNFTVSRKETFQAYVAAISLWMLTFPFYFWKLADYSVFVYRVFFLVVLGIIFIRYKNTCHNKIDKNLTLLYVVTLLFFIISTLFKGNANVFGLVSPFFNLILLRIAFSNISFLEKVFSCFAKVFAYTIVISLVVWVMMLCGIVSSYGMIDNLGHDRLYYHYPFLIVMAEDLNHIVDTFRFHGPYDEPGVVGTFCSLILCVNKFNLKRIENIICLIAGLCSFSFFFTIIVSVYGLFYFTFVERNKKILVLFVLIGSLFYIKTKDNEMIYSTLWKRFEYNQDAKKIEGVNRMSDEADLFYNNLSISEYLFGGDEKEYNKVVEGSASYKSVIVSNGAIFLVLYLLFYIIYAKSRIKGRLSFLLFLLVLLGNTFQRPDIYGAVNFFLYICLANNSNFSVASISAVDYKSRRIKYLNGSC